MPACLHQGAGKYGPTGESGGSAPRQGANAAERHPQSQNSTLPAVGVHPGVLPNGSPSPETAPHQVGP